ncbi:MAG: T9SS type A sorting domain-containing protein [Prolixibacteraceae bacterium]|nr:T9SS type A sorting domain-containing protein [Prolixibacteraceae bacterium]
MRYLFIVLHFLAISGFSLAQQHETKMSDFMGINSNVASYDEHYLADLAKCTKWMREYHSWAQYEVADNYYKWDTITTCPQGDSWPDHNKFMDKCRQLGINILIDVLNKPSWAGGNRGAYSLGDGSKTTDYLDKLEFMGQLVARYGSQKVDPSKLETADKISGLGYVKYFEDDNEPDYWWSNPKWPAGNYAVYCNAVHDGYGVETNSEYPLLGIKSVDSTALHVLAGLAKNDSVYIQKILNASHGRVPFDVINIHTYCTDKTNGYAPENENFGLEKNLGNFMDWRNRVLPDIPVWITEFGWDTFSNQNQHSTIYAPQQQQANYILRSYFILLKMGFEKAFLFMDKDSNSQSTGNYSTSGIFTDKNRGWQKKKSFYYLATMQKVLGNAVLEKVVSYRQTKGVNEIFCFEFVNDSSEQVYALWAREKNSNTDNGTTLNYSFDIGYHPGYAYSIAPEDKNMEGVKKSLVFNASSVDLSLSETPLFLVVAENKTASIQHKKEKKINLVTFPNPADNLVQISFFNPKFQKVKITAFSPDGKQINVIADQSLEAGQQHFTFGENVQPGLYFLQVSTNCEREVKKILIR